MAAGKTFAASVARIAVMPAPALAQATTTTSGESRPFLKSPGGVAAVVLMIAAGGFVIYKVGKDQKTVKSPIR